MKLESHQEIIQVVDLKKTDTEYARSAYSFFQNPDTALLPAPHHWQGCCKKSIFTVSAQQGQVRDASFFLLKVKWTSALLPRSSVTEHWQGKWGGPTVPVVGTSRGHPIHWSGHQDLTGICCVLGGSVLVLFPIHLPFLHWSHWFRAKYSREHFFAMQLSYREVACLAVTAFKETATEKTLKICRCEMVQLKTTATPTRICLYVDLSLLTYFIPL